MGIVVLACLLLQVGCATSNRSAMAVLVSLPCLALLCRTGLCWSVTLTIIAARVSISIEHSLREHSYAFDPY